MKILTSPIIEVVIVILLILIGVVAVKIGISFDINAWNKERLKHKKDKLQILCPHTEITPNLEVKSLFYSPSGTTSWICSKCQLQTFDSRVPEQLVKYYAENPDVYLEQLKKFDRLFRKIYKI